MDISMVLSIIAIISSLFTLLFYLFQEYRELITLYWFAEYDVVFVPRDDQGKTKPSEFIDKYFKEYHRNIQICEFKHKWVGCLDRTYYQQTINDYARNLDELLVRSVMINPEEYNMVVRVIVTHHGKRSLKYRMKNVRKAV